MAVIAKVLAATTWPTGLHYGYKLTA